MENQINKCTFKDHEETDAICYCVECKINMCNKCENLHSKLFNNHHTYKSDKDINEIFTGICKEKEHNEQLEFFCKTHNTLCCTSCLCKIKKKGKGQHKYCDVVIIEEIQEEKKKKLKENIKSLEELSNNLFESIKQLKNIFENIKKDKENLKLNIQKVFTNIRNTVNEREDEILLELDKIYDNAYFKEDIIKESEKLPNIVKLSLEKGKSMEETWNNENKLSLLINDCINIENNVKNINRINENIKKYNFNKLKIKFEPENDKKLLSKFLDNLKIFGKIIKVNDFIKFDSLIINNNYEYNNILINWINPENNTLNIKSELLYRKSKDGDSYDIFHKLCDNKGPTLTLIKGTEGFIIGGYTPLDWDNHSGWKKDYDTFVFSLNNNKVFRKNKNDISIYCMRDIGVWFPFIGFRETGNKNMSQGEFIFNSNINFNNFNEIIPNEKKDRFFDVEETEVFKIIFN